MLSKHSAFRIQFTFLTVPDSLTNTIFPIQKSEGKEKKKSKDFELRISSKKWENKWNEGSNPVFLCRKRF